MKIYTKKGDQGDTSLFGGQRLKKSDLRLECYGGTDELNSHLGLIQSTSKFSNPLIKSLQISLFEIGSHLAADPSSKNLQLPEINISIVEKMESEIDFMNESLPPLKTFILPGGTLSASHCHVARTVCRRVERMVVGLNERDGVDGQIIIFLNRLSDYLFVYARYLVYKEGGEEFKWMPSK